VGKIENDFVFHPAFGPKFISKIGQKLFEIFHGLPGQQYVLAINPVSQFILFAWLSGLFFYIVAIRIRHLCLHYLVELTSDHAKEKPSHALFGLVLEVPNIDCKKAFEARVDVTRTDCMENNFDLAASDRFDEGLALLRSRY
jgi:hypothetical protein